jgi:hypothetical protein
MPPVGRSKRAKSFLSFASHVADYIDDYTVPKYGDSGKDLCSGYTFEQCMREIAKYAARNISKHGKRHDIEKIVHYAQMAYDIKLREWQNRSWYKKLWDWVKYVCKGEK